METQKKENKWKTYLENYDSIFSMNDQETEISQKLDDDNNDLKESLSDNDNDDLEELLSDNDNDDLEELLNDNDDLEELLSDNDDLEESISDIDNNNLEESLNEMSIDEDVIDDSNKTKLSESMVLALRLLNLKCKHNFTNNAFTDILNLIGSDLDEGSTLYLAKKERYIISHNSKKPQKPQKTAMYFPLLDRFRIQYADSERALKLQYRSQREECNDGYSDIFDGDLYKELVEEVRVKKENLLISAIIPDPNQPKDFNSFLRPIIDELKILQGDIPAISKLMCMTGHNAYLGCRFCYLKGVYSEESRHVYFPCSMLRTSNITNFDLKELPKHTENNFLNDISKIINETNRTTRLSYIKETGINGHNILFELKSTKFSRSFPIDIMHLFFENISINMFKHWNGAYFKNQLLNNEQYVINNHVWKQIGQFMHECCKQIPLEFGRPPRNIYKHHNGYKAIE
ncbi:transposase domain-containing protein [Rhizophagus clarus]|uniref:Transposase domain-containing protein n=1 Tax=Rhizophagus clarus TaxID=94130 RepID=A0A8H3R4S4_9GLOM|nr:transposase domain-containing protein [Rhizophagus clarus]